MATLHYNTTTGAVVRVLSTDALLARFPAPDAGEAAFDLDPDTNAALVADVAANPSPYTVASGQLRKAGSPVAVAADGPARTDHRAFVNAVAAAISADTAFLVIASPTNAQTLAQVQELTRQARAIIKRLAQI